MDSSTITIISTVFMVIFAIEGIWWIVWMAIAAARKIFANFYFMLITFIIWCIIDIISLQNMNPAFAIVDFILAIVPFIILPGMVKVITEYQRGVLFRFGKLSGLLGPGFNVIFPFGIDRVIKVDLRTFTIDVAKQEIITKDNVPVFVDAVVYFNVFDPILAITKVANYTQSTTLLGQTILRSILGQHELDEMLSKRAELNEKLRQLLDEATDPWGIKVTMVEIKSIELPDTMKRAMAKQAEAERERRAKVISADGEFQASQKLMEAAQVISKEPAAIQLRYLQTLPEIAAEKNSTILFPLPIELLNVFKKLSEQNSNNEE
ncbi:slipin family protein [Thermoanaerobacterium sp. RBIITD]|uniref:slipin family protein n=1 Tax=Thermoanaerobacterium sp. RBIITD TaxID=1550240 RepID=UPI000BB8EEA3|nr:slipin family protein [Thermoanaerobacterium sp. RBIITD]SNX54538.1 Regulator of protease activity HflC, stomatin/prohibitin superfamily [Thermoanaerobacterium sp. RBIITD]